MIEFSRGLVPVQAAELPSFLTEFGLRLEESLLSFYEEYEAAVTSLTAAIAASSEFSSGDRMLFHQTAAPVGWTKDTTLNDKALRVVSGVVGSGGTNGFSTIFNSTIVTGGHALVLDELPAHSHGGGNHRHTYNVGASGTGEAESGNASAARNTSYSGTIINTEGGGLAHDHDLAFDLAFVDIIIAEKD